MLSAIIVAGGTSRRMGFDKTFALLGERPVIVHTLAAFEAATCVAEIIVVGREDRLEELRGLAAQFRLTKVGSVIAGGVQRQDSVNAGLLAADAAAQFIAVHDAARPLVTPAQIAEVFAAARTHGAASLAAPVSDTLKRADADRIVRGSLERAGVWAMQTPQIFRRDLLLEAYRGIAEESLAITDDVSALQHLGHDVILVAADETNLKITFPADLALAEFVLTRRH